MGSWASKPDGERPGSCRTSSASASRPSVCDALGERRVDA